MVYMGSKRRYCKYIVPIIQKYIDENNIGIFIDLFCGGANLTDKINCDYVYGNDLSPSLIALHKQAQEDFSLIPTDGNREYWDAAYADWKNIKAAMDKGEAIPPTENPNIETIYNQDFFADDYGESFPSVDYIIMNPPYSVIEPFVIRALEIPKKGVLMLGRLQFLEGQNRYATIFQKNPPSDVYIYVDRIACFKNGDTSKKMDSAQAYAWFYFDIEKMKTNKTTEVHWIRRVDKS